MGMRGWIELYADVNWQEHGGTWGRPVVNRQWMGDWVLLLFTNWQSTLGRDFDPEKDKKYCCEVRLLEIPRIDLHHRKFAMHGSGYSLDDDGRLVVDKRGVKQSERDGAVILAAALAMSGYGAPTDDVYGNRADRVRAEARRYAEDLRRDEHLRAIALERQVNEIGSTAREMGAGDLESALHRGPFDQEKNLVRKLHGFPPGQ